MTSSYRDYEAEAHALIERLLKSSIEKLRKEQLEEGMQQQPSFQTKVEWPNGKSFTEENGLEAIEHLVKSWKIGESWKYCIDFLIQRDKLYCYAVKWSEPTRRKPVPKATVSVFFYLLVHSDDAPALVLYVVEGQRLAHKPENTVFHEVWLRNVIQNKLAVTDAASLALSK